MKCKSLGLAVLLAAFAASALAQTQISGTRKCGKADPAQTQTIEVGDQPGHVLVIEKGTCPMGVPFEMAGLKSTTFAAAESVDVTAAKFQTRGYGVITMDNGDKAYVRFQGSGTMKNGTPDTGEGTWSYTGGTGKLKGVKGKGTWKSSNAPNGEGEDQLQGEYTLPETGAAAGKK